MTVPPPLKTIKEILDELHTETNHEWGTLNGVFALVRANLNGRVVDFLGSKSSVLLKVFFDKATGEVRTYIAKDLDEHGREEFY